MDGVGQLGGIADREGLQTGAAEYPCAEEGSVRISARALSKNPKPTDCNPWAFASIQSPCESGPPRHRRHLSVRRSADADGIAPGLLEEAAGAAGATARGARSRHWPRARMHDPRISLHGT